LLIEVTTPAGQQSGLHFNSVVNCSHLLTLDQSEVLATLGSLPSAVMDQINDCLKAVLELP